MFTTLSLEMREPSRWGDNNGAHSEGGRKAEKDRTDDIARTQTYIHVGFLETVQ